MIHFASGNASITNGTYAQVWKIVLKIGVCLMRHRKSDSNSNAAISSFSRPIHFFINFCRHVFQCFHFRKIEFFCKNTPIILQLSGVRCQDFFWKEYLYCSTRRFYSVLLERWSWERLNVNVNQIVKQINRFPNAFRI